jgi:hypothetical protein
VRQPLILHPDCTCPSVQAIDVEITESEPGVLTLWYTVTGDLDALVIPAPAAERRADGLWTTTCFELFLKPLCSSGYLELNFSPSSQWAGYEFAGYREGMAQAELAALPVITTAYPFGLLETHVTISRPSSDAQRIGVSAVIEERSGNKSCWALAHPPGAPDFHHPTCFALELPAAGAP